VSVHIYFQLLLKSGHFLIGRPPRDNDLFSPKSQSPPRRSDQKTVYGGGSLWHLIRVLHQPNLYHSCCQDDRCLTLTKPVSEHQLSNMLGR
jgi:hypothetical protein